MAHLLAPGSWHLLAAALCATALSAPEGRLLRPEEHWRPAAGHLDLARYQARTATVPPGGQAGMARLERLATEMRASPSTKKDSGQPKASCGIQGPAAMDRIVGGAEAAEHAWPWQVGLIVDDAWFCGGSIISENYVLTAAHCAEGGTAFKVIAGAHRVMGGDNPDYRVEVTSYNGWTHPAWNSDDLVAGNDLALIELPSPLQFNDYISAACLPEKGDILEVGDLVGVTGWGKDSDTANTISKVLMEVFNLPVISNERCSMVFGHITDASVCVDTAGGRGTCGVSQDTCKGTHRLEIHGCVIHDLARHDFSRYDLAIHDLEIYIFAIHDHGICWAMHGLAISGLAIHGLEIHGLTIPGFTIHCLEIYGLAIHGLAIHGLDIHGTAIQCLAIPGLVILGSGVQSRLISSVDYCAIHEITIHLSIQYMILQLIISL